jgi:cyanophycinase
VAGTLVIIGGGEDRTGERAVLRRIVDLAGGPSARVVVLGTATTIPDELETMYRKAFDGLGAGEVEFLPVSSRDEANDPETVEAIDAASAVFFTGGDQSRIAAIFGGSDADTALHDAWQRGIVVAGTSAGAAMMSTTMILGGGEQVPSTSVRTGPGLGFVSGIVVDMHFAERGRIARLLAVVAMFPHELGLGIDEDTAVVVHETRFEVIGTGAVTVVDAGHASSVRIPAVGNGPIALTNGHIHVLPSGYAFELLTRTPVIVDAPVDSRARERGE